MLLTGTGLGPSAGRGLSPHADTGHRAWPPVLTQAQGSAHVVTFDTGPCPSEAQVQALVLVLAAVPLEGGPRMPEGCRLWRGPLQTLPWQP